MLSPVPYYGDKKIIVIIPVYNESIIVRDVVNRLYETQLRTIIVVDDGSKNNIQELLKDFPVFYLRHRINLGQGAALQTGFTFAKSLDADMVITFDADGQHDVGDIEALIQPVKDDETDVTMGSRFLSAGNNQIPQVKKMILKMARVVNFLLTGMLLTDAHNGLRVMNKNALGKIYLTENRMAHASEFLFQLKKHKLRYKEVPVKISYTNYAREKGQSPWDSIKILFDLVLHKLFR